MREADYYLIELVYDDHYSIKTCIVDASSKEEAERKAQEYEKNGWETTIHACIEGDET